MICVDPTCTNGRVYCIGSKASRSEPKTTRSYKCQDCNLTFFTIETFDHIAMKRGMDQAEENRRLRVMADLEAQESPV